MNRNYVSSSNIRSIGFDPDSNTLEVEFHGGGLYQYDGVSQELYDEFMNSGSKGRFFHLNIKNDYSYRRIS